MLTTIFVYLLLFGSGLVVGMLFNQYLEEKRLNEFAKSMFKQESDRADKWRDQCMRDRRRYSKDK